MRRRNRKRIEITPKYFLLALTIVCVVLMIASLFFDSIMPSVRKATNTFILPMQKGYKEILDYLDGVTSLDEALYILKRDTRHFAKRQITWFKREKEVTWVDKSEFTSEDTIMDFMLEQLRSKGIIS